MRGVDLLREIGDRDGRHATDDQPFEISPGEQQLIGGRERNEKTDGGRDGDRNRYRPDPAMRSASVDHGITPIARPTVDAEMVRAASAAPMCRSAEISGRTACGE